MTMRVSWLRFGATTVRRLDRPENGRRFRALLEGLDPEFTPSHAIYFEGRAGRKAVTLQDIEAHGFWSSPYSVEVQLANRRNGLKGGMVMLRDNSGSGYITGGYDLAALYRRNLFQDAMRLFEGIVELTKASDAYLSDGGGSILGMSLQCLPQFYSWINVLGPEYVELLGREKLLALDIYKKHEDSAGRLWLQMAERPEQMHLLEMKEHVKQLMKSLDADDVFCPDPALPPEPWSKDGGRKYRTPKFDRSELHDVGPYSTRFSGTSVSFSKRGRAWNMSIGFDRTICPKQKYMGVLQGVFEVVLKTKSPPGPFGVALLESGELRSVRPKDREQWTYQEQADLVVERLVRVKEKERVVAVGACFWGRGPVPGQTGDTEAFRIHLESEDGDPYTVYLPVKREGRKREYGVLIVEPGERIIFANESNV